MAIKGILFDKDGTLIDILATFGPATALVIDELADGDEALADALAKAGAFDRKSFQIHPSSILIAGSLQEIADNWLPDLPEYDAHSLLQEIDTLYEKHSLTSLAPFDFLEATLNRLDLMALPYGIGTNDSQSAAQAHMSALNLKDRFSAIMGFDSGFGGKPGPGMVIGFASHLNCRSEELAMVGDSTHDLIAARSAGALSIGVTSGPASARDLAGEADHILPDISTLPDLIEQINSGAPT